MMRLCFLSDPHLGVLRNSHTTPDSRRRLQKAMLSAARGAIGVLEACGNGAPIFCLGDLFDTWANEEAVIADALQLMPRVTRVLAGNHDLPNRDDKVASLELLDSALDAAGEGAKIVRARVDQAGYDWWRSDDRHDRGLVVFVPHHASQEMFQQALIEAADFARQQTDDHKILCLHCNYDLSFEATDPTLNLTREMAKGLLGSFTHILIGHEHVARSDFGGRLQLLGNTHPTSFSDVSDKFVWIFENGGLISKRIWSQADGYAKLHWTDIVDAPPETWDVPNYPQFVEVEGTAPADRLPAIARAVSSLWKFFPNAFLIRNSVRVEQTTTAQVTAEEVRAMDLPSRIGKELEGTPLHETWIKYLQRVQG